MSEQNTSPETEAQSKGRATPSRKEAEAARLAKVKRPRTRKEIAAQNRALRREGTDKQRSALRTGRERDLPARDKGPMKRFIRDWIDRKFTLAELALPLMFVVLALSWTKSSAIASISNILLLLILVTVIAQVVTMRFFLRRELVRRFPGESYRGTTYYASMRALQLRFLRLPKAQVKVGAELPETYR